MARQESSVMSSLQQLMVEEDQRRAEQIALAHRRKLEQEREVFEQEQRRAEQSRRVAEAAKRQVTQQAADERAEHERQETERLCELERVRSGLELRARVAVMQSEQQHELERLAIARDRRVARLEGQRLLLSALLGTLVSGWVLIQLAVVRPASIRQDQTISELNRSALERQSVHDQERERMGHRIKALESEVAQLDSQLSLVRKRLSERDPQHQHATISHATAGDRRPVKPETCIDDNDPLCGTLRSK